jgi:hypothetical protein
MSGLPDPSLSAFPRLDYVVRGIRRENAARPKLKRLPITPSILLRIHDAWSRVPASPDQTMLWAAFCLGFFGFLRAGEFTCPSKAMFTPVMLGADDVAVDSHLCPSHMTVRLKQSPLGWHRKHCVQWQQYWATLLNAQLVQACLGMAQPSLNHV